MAIALNRSCNLNDTAFWRAVYSGNALKLQENCCYFQGKGTLTVFLETQTDMLCFQANGVGEWRVVQSQSEVTVVVISSLREKVWRVGRKHVIETLPSDSHVRTVPCYVTASEFAKHKTRPCWLLVAFSSGFIDDHSIWNGTNQAVKVCRWYQLFWSACQFP
jgi:hypothetical protein